jgi:hypothetical protein
VASSSLTTASCPFLAAYVYGLFASIWTKDVAKALKVAEKIEAGMITINKAFGFDTNSAFGGWKGSGVGREDGQYGSKELLQEKTMKIAMTLETPTLEDIFIANLFRLNVSLPNLDVHLEPTISTKKTLFNAPLGNI